MFMTIHAKYWVQRLTVPEKYVENFKRGFGCFTTDYCCVYHTVTPTTLNIATQFCVKAIY